VGNKAISDNTLVRAAIEQLSGKLPPVGGSRRPHRETPRHSANILRIRGPGSNSASILVDAKQRLEPKDLDYMVSVLRPGRELPVLFVSPFLSPRTQERLKAVGFGYANLTR